MFTGSMVAVATPMNDDGSIDYKSYQYHEVLGYSELVMPWIDWISW